jgi:DNA-directed RNA polymerase alpha subunit
MNMNININLLSVDELIRIKLLINNRLKELSNDIYLTDTELPLRVLNTLRKNNIVTLTQLTNSNYKAMRGLGMKGRNEIEDTLLTYYVDKV